MELGNSKQNTIQVISHKDSNVEMENNPYEKK